MAEGKHGRQCGLAVAMTYREDSGAHDALAALVGRINGADETPLPRTQLEKRAGERARAYGK